MRVHLLRAFGAFLVTIGIAPWLGGTALAADHPDHKVTICHRTDSDTNPYNRITVDTDAAGGGQDQGAGDHYAEHQGPVWNPTLKDDHKEWGDIIPPYVDDQNVDFAGYNWDDDGMAIYANGCNPPGEVCPTAIPTVTVTATETAKETVTATATATKTATATVTAPGETVTVTETAPGPTVTKTKTETVPGPTVTKTETVKATETVPGPTVTKTETVKATETVPGPTLTKTETVKVTETVPGPTVTKTETVKVTETVPGPTVTKTETVKATETVTETATATATVTATETATATVTAPGSTVTATHTATAPGATVTVTKTAGVSVLPTKIGTSPAVVPTATSGGVLPQTGLKLSMPSAIALSFALVLAGSALLALPGRVAVERGRRH